MAGGVNTCPSVAMSQRGSFGALAAGAVVERVAGCPGAQRAFFMAGLGAKRLQRLAQLLDAHGRAGQWQPAVATGAGGC